MANHIYLESFLLVIISFDYFNMTMFSTLQEYLNIAKEFGLHPVSLSIGLLTSSYISSVRAILILAWRFNACV